MWGGRGVNVRGVKMTDAVYKAIIRLEKNPGLMAVFVDGFSVSRIEGRRCLVCGHEVIGVMDPDDITEEYEPTCSFYACGRCETFRGINSTYDPVKSGMLGFDTAVEVEKK